ncbi:MAG: hypothetical protein KatS3mg031_1146 [Chitinophagales bacterium]|nr:MAG: hypothetical protein KatS3mg031_1146 [Chitinophagales bacterium]
MLPQHATPFNGNFHDGRMQMLFRKSELAASGMQRGILTSLALQIAFKNSLTPFSGFTIKMGCTSADVIGTAFQPNLEIVFNPKNITTTSGWNTFNFDNPYDWDGYSNLLVEICFDNNGYAGADIVRYAATPFSSVLYAQADFTSGCQLTNPTATSSRPNVRFGISPPPQGVFTYSWTPTTTLSDPNISNPVATPTDTTFYVVRVTDGTCFATDTVEVYFYNTYNVNVFGQNLGCNGVSDGNAVSVPVGGEPPYTFVWSTSQTNSGVMSDTLFNLPAGIYSVTVTDNNNCQASDTVEITVPPPLVLTLTAQHVDCFGANTGRAIAAASGGTPGYAFIWQNGTIGPVADLLVAGTYSVTLTDYSGCTVSDAVAITQPPALTTTTFATDASCFGYQDGSVGVSVSGGTPPYSYLWQNNQTGSLVTGLAAGTYTVTVTDDSGCVAVDNAAVGQPDSFSISLGTTPVSCFNGSDGGASASVQGDTVNYTFRWALQPPQNTATVSGLPAGVYTVTITDTLGCSQSRTVTIVQPPDMVLNWQVTPASCNGSSDGEAVVQVIAGGTRPFMYQWSTLAQDSIASGLAAGTYYVSVTDVNNCIKEDSVTIGEPLPLSLSLQNTVDVSCFGLNDGILLVSATGGTPPYQYLWSNQQNMPVAANLAAGLYSVTVIDDNGCIDSLTSLVVEEPPALSLAVDVIRPCIGEAGGVIHITAFGGTPPYQYAMNSNSWQSESAYTGLTAGAYTVKVSDQQMCETDSTVTLQAYPPVEVSFDTNRIKINLGQEIQLMPIIDPSGNNYLYDWIPANGLSCTDCQQPYASPVSTSTYVFHVTDTTTSCSYRDTIIVEVANELIVVVPNAFTPDGDGENDILKVLGISIASADFQIFNRWGQKVFETQDGTRVGWDGTIKEKKATPGVYVYYVRAVFDDGQEKQIKGSVTLIR